MAGVTFHTASWMDVLNYAVVAQEVRGELLSELLKPRWAKQRFSAWRCKQRTLARWWGALAAGRLEDGTLGIPPTILFGDASFQASRGGVSTPTTGNYAAAARAATSSRGNIFSICEWGEWKQ
jgi:hypothetical protein